MIPRSTRSSCGHERATVEQLDRRREDVLRRCPASPRCYVSGSRAVLGACNHRILHMILNTSDRIMYDRLCGSGGALEAAAVASKDTSLYVIAGHREGVTQRTRSSVSTKRTVADIEHTRRVDLRWGGQRTPTHTTLGDIGGDRMFIPMLWAAET